MDFLPRARPDAAHISLTGRRTVLTAIGSLGVVALALRPSALAPLADAHAEVLAAAPNLNQQGLTGAWYDPTMPGQGLLIETYPDLLGSGTGFVFGGWFTYEAVGGVEQQRWYSFSGSITDGVSTAAVTIYRNTGGNFDAAPVTFAVEVGTGELRFDSCTAGRFDFSMSDGRSGTMLLTRLLPDVACASAGTTTSTDVDFAYSGAWYDPATSGQGFFLEVNPNSPYVFLAWFTYVADGQSQPGAGGQRWYTGQSVYVRSSRSIELVLYETVGGTFNQPSATTTTAVGRATLGFTGCDSATLAYAFTGGALAGRSGALRVTRTGSTPKACVFGGSCALIPQETAGPFPLSSVLSQTGIVRRDIRDGHIGVPLTIVLKLVNANNGCAPVANAAVYIWHCDKDGVYSGYANQTGGVNATGQSFLRGVQVSDGTGQVVFTTIYPGWYAGRITHVHFQVFLGGVLNGTATRTSQFAFPPAITTAVYASSLYASHGQNSSVASLAQDNVFSDGVTYQLAGVTGNVVDGYVATLVVGIAA